MLCLVALKEQESALNYVRSFEVEADRWVSIFFGMMLLQTESVFFRPSFLAGLGDASVLPLRRLASLGIGEELREQDILLGRSIELFDDVRTRECISHQLAAIA